MIWPNYPNQTFFKPTKQKRVANSSVVTKSFGLSLVSPAMVRKRFQKPAFKLEKFMERIGFGRDERFFYRQCSKAMIGVYVVGALGWWFNETSPLGWWTLKPKPKEEKELAHLYERRKFPYPGDEEAMEEFVAKGGMIGTVIGPKGFIELDRDSFNYQKALQDQKVEQEAQKLWTRMRNEVVTEFQEKGFDVE